MSSNVDGVVSKCMYLDERYQCQTDENSYRHRLVSGGDLSGG
jgi:hypothetical protein